jgi:DNA-binding transcriptional LysR family regulator
VYELVQNDQVDFGIVSYPKQKRDIQVTAWREEPMGLVCSPRHPLAARSSVSWESLDGMRMVSFDDNLMIRRQIDRALVEAGSHVEVAMEFDNIETIKRAIEIDLGVSVLPIFTVRNEVESGRLAAIPMEDDFRRPVGIIRRRGKELGRTALRFMQTLLEQANQPINGECSEL